VSDFRTITTVVAGSPGDVVRYIRDREENGLEVKVICPSHVPEMTYVTFEFEVVQ
jgi:hypothetical protein